MSSPSRRSLLRHPEVVDTSCSYRRSKLSAFFSCSSAQQQSFPKTPASYASSAASSTSQSDFSHDASTARHSSSFDDSPSPRPSRSPTPVILPANTVREKKQGISSGRNRAEKKGNGVEESVEVVMESSNPYLDFRNSMVMMIVEKEIYAWDDLRELLRRFLLLNSPCHHHHILRAFSEILSHVFNPAVVAGAESSGNGLREKKQGIFEGDD